MRGGKGVVVVLMRQYTERVLRRWNWAGDFKIHAARQAINGQLFGFYHARVRLSRFDKGSYSDEEK